MRSGSTPSNVQWGNG